MCGVWTFGFLTVLQQRNNQNGETLFDASVSSAQATVISTVKGPYEYAKKYLSNGLSTEPDYRLWAR